jgi:hypothetical protein
MYRRRGTTTSIKFGVEIQGNRALYILSMTLVMLEILDVVSCCYEHSTLSLVIFPIADTMNQGQALTNGE